MWSFEPWRGALQARRRRAYGPPKGGPYAIRQCRAVRHRARPSPCRGAPWRGPRAAVVLSALLLLSACTLQRTQYELKNQPLSCDDANRLAYRTIEAMRFKVSEFQPGAPGQRGMIKASRAASGSDDERRVTITIDCTPTGADLDISEEGKWLEQLEIERAFHHAYVNIVSMNKSRAELDRQIAAGTAPASQQRRDLVVIVEPRRGPAAKLDFAFDLAAAGVLPVRLVITNLTPRSYTLDPAEIRLTRTDRERIAALAPGEAAARVAAIAAQPAPTASPETIASALAAKEFTATVIPAGAEREGFLYFPLADYTGARLLMTDEETGEAEGVRVEF